MAQPMDDLDKQIAQLKREIDQKSEQNKSENTAPTTSIAVQGPMPTQRDPVVVSEEKKENDARSVFIRGLDWNTTGDELSDFLQDCGAVERVTLLHDSHANRPKGHAYVCFADAQGADNAIATKNLGTLRGRTLTITKKRTNVPGMKQRAPRQPQASDPNAAAMAAATATATMMASMAQGMQGGENPFANFMSMMMGQQGHPSDGVPPMRGRGYGRGPMLPRGMRGRGGRGMPPYM